MRIPRFWGLHAEPGPKFNIGLAILPFVILISAYMLGSMVYLDNNPRGKLVPSIGQMYDEFHKYAFTVKKKHQDKPFMENVLDGNYLLLTDMAQSLKRIIFGVGLAAIVGLFLGMNMALFPAMRSTCNPLVTFLSIIPPLALMPILLITMGTGDVAKVGLIFLGTFFAITRDVFRETKAIPKEQITKALTLGATQFEVVYKIVLPQIMPSLLSTVRLNLGAAWLFLIAGEAVASSDGLGYRIYVVKRYLAMDTIIPYVLIITLLGFLMDYLLRKFIQIKYPWYVAVKGGK